MELVPKPYGLLGAMLVVILLSHVLSLDSAKGFVLGVFAGVIGTYVEIPGQWWRY